MWSQINQMFEPLKQRFEQFWQPLAQREKRMLILLGLFLFWLLLYALLWQPMQGERERAYQQLNSAQNQWLWLNEQVPVWQRQGQQGPEKVKDRNQLMSKVQQSLRQMNLHRQMSKVDLTTKGVRVVFKEVDAARLLQWLATLEQQGIVSNKALLNPQDSLPEGKVEATIDFVVSS